MRYLIIILLFAVTAQSQTFEGRQLTKVDSLSTGNYQVLIDSTGNVYYNGTFQVKSGYLLSPAESYFNRAGLLLIQNVSKDEFDFLIEAIKYFETGNKLKKWLNR